MLMNLLTGLAMSLLLTLVIELLVALPFGITKKQSFLVVVLVNVLTNPTVVYTYYVITAIWSLTRSTQLWIQLFLELVVILVEASMYAKYTKEQILTIRHPVRYAICANVLAWAAGLVLVVL